MTPTRLRVLVLTNHFADFAGSEMVALEIAEWFGRRGDEVTIGTNHAASPMTDHASEFTITTAVERLELAEFDLVWCQHDLLSLLPLATFRYAARHRVPHVAIAGLSPTLPFEQVNAVLARALSADIFANSAKTADAIAAIGHGEISRRRITVFNNAAPADFWARRRPASPAPRSLNSVTLISNHPPHEMLVALARLADRGVKVRRIGAHGEEVRVGPAQLDADAIVTIGKSVIYALAQRRPVYLYDAFGGDGWLTPDNWDTNRFHNFAGHPTKRRLSAAEIVDELTAGFDAADRQTAHLVDGLGPEFRLEHHLEALRQRAMRRTGALRALRFRRRMTSPTLLAHLEISNRKSLLVRRYFIGLSGSKPPHSVAPAKWWGEG